jgi:nitrile hydratase
MTERSDIGNYQPLTYFQLMEVSLRELLVEKGIVSEQAVSDAVEDMRRRGPDTGARVVVKAWLDPDFKRLLLENGTRACEAMGIDVPATRLVVVENTPREHNVIVCTLCSCYPRMLLGIPPDWYKSRNYRARVVREPRTVLAEFGLRIAEDVTIRVHDSTADMRYMVLPMRPAGSEDWDAARLAATVSRDCMIGVAVPKL